MLKMYKVDLNCDLGESFGSYTIGRDADILPLITSANIACGMHAGDPVVMRKTVRLALDAGVALGAHPGLPDLMGFGRRRMDISPEEAYALVLYQTGALAAFAAAEGARLQHVKPHGALYNMAAKDYLLAHAIARAVYDLDPELILFGLAGSESVRAAQDVGLRVASEVFADRAYLPDGSLMPRSEIGAVFTDEKESLAQALSLVTGGKVTAAGGAQIAVQADTICVHGDGIKALAFTRKIRAALEEHKVTVCNFMQG